MSVPNIERCVQIVIIFLYDTAAYKTRFNSVAISVKHFLKCLETAGSSNCEENYKQKGIQGVTEKDCAESLLFLNRYSLALCEHGTEPVIQVPAASLTTYTCGMKVGQTREILVYFFHN